ncbi:MAG: DUF3786 domain-containing protein [Gemmatimonadetes bacterium]|nr:DUF3786 domain-containing protein [Gemmatimonadota bacterium]
MQRDNLQGNPLEKLRDNPRDSWQEAWTTAVELAVDELRQVDLEECCSRSGAVWNREDAVLGLSFLNRAYKVRIPEFDVISETGEEAPIREKILLLHYLQTASGTPLKGEWIAFTQVPSGELYLGNFRARSVDRLVRSFDGRETELVEMAEALEGVAGEYGDVSVVLRALPRVPVALVLWRGDEEFPPSGDVLFDATVVDYLPMEDMVVLAEMVASQLCNKKGKAV